jgi:hypothetical protein
MVVLPRPTIVTTFLTIVATSVFELVYVMGPLLFVVGGVNVNGASPKVFDGTVKFDIVVVARVTIRDAVAVAAV